MQLLSRVQLDSGAPPPNLVGKGSPRYRNYERPERAQLAQPIDAAEQAAENFLDDVVDLGAGAERATSHTTHQRQKFLPDRARRRRVSRDERRSQVGLAVRSARGGPV